MYTTKYEKYTKFLGALTTGMHIYARAFIKGIRQCGRHFTHLHVKR